MKTKRVKVRQNEYACTHPGREAFHLLDYLGAKMTLRLCPDCQEIPEFADIIRRNEDLDRRGGQ